MFYVYVSCVNLTRLCLQSSPSWLYPSAPLAIAARAAPIGESSLLLQRLKLPRYTDAGVCQPELVPEEMKIVRFVALRITRERNRHGNPFSIAPNVSGDKLLGKSVGY